MADSVTPDYAALIEASPFAVLATSGPEGLDCSPRGDQPGFVRVADPRTLILPDRRGNNRIDSLRNIVRDPRVALLFLIPGSGTTLRVNGRAVISADPDLLATFRVDGHAPRTAIVITVAEIYFQCAGRSSGPSCGIRMPASIRRACRRPGRSSRRSAGAVGGQRYDAEWPERAAKTMW